ncbi:MAG: dihydropteroate synthase [Candidatus Baltobacteraceae bacterium]
MLPRARFITNSTKSPGGPALVLRDRRLALDGPAHVMGILNTTPDSFFDRGRYREVDAARARAAEMVEQGATLIDIGGQSYAAGNPRVAERDERARVVPILEALVRDRLDVAFTIDTYRPEVADAALAAGAHAINDCSGSADPALADVVARHDAGLVVMHLKGELNVRRADYGYDDVLAEVVAFLGERIGLAREAGVRGDAIVADPGLEFGKEPATDLEILGRFGDLRALGVPLLLAASRKHFLGRLFARGSETLLAPSLAAAAIGIAAGARIVRAHDIAETVDLARLLAFATPAAGVQRELASA